jgi:hypothetical protein
MTLRHFAEPVAAAAPQTRLDAGTRAGPAPIGSSPSASIPTSPVPSTVRMAQQTLRKRDFESELLDRLLNGAQAAAPAQGEDVPLK